MLPSTRTTGGWTILPRDEVVAEIRIFERAQQMAGRLLTEVVRLDLYGRQVAQAQADGRLPRWEAIEGVFAEAGFSWHSDEIRASIAHHTRRVDNAVETAPRERE